jgi:hypothetical protein
VRKDDILFSDHDQLHFSFTKEVRFELE